MATTGPTSDSNMSRRSSVTMSPRQVRSRTQSISSDRPSTIGCSLGLTSPPLSVSPEPAFIAASAASQIVTNDHDNHAGTWYDQNGIEPSSETALVSPAALQLVNGFLDQLLFNFLQVSKATTLSALRPAVSEILKPKLAKDAIGIADEELREYLGGGEEDDYVQPLGSGASRNWDGELVWKRTRLRCMVYSSLGDMEEEDEDLYMEQENLEIGAHEQPSDVISPAVAIFLTSLLEYMGELTLTVAGQAACHRVRSKIEKGLKDGSRNPADRADQVVVSEMDMERVALDRTLGRLWRGWKKRMRSPGGDHNGRPFSATSAGHYKDHGAAEAHAVKSVTSDNSSEMRQSRDHFDDAIAEVVQPMDIPLPMGDNDVDEIEVPGLAHHSDDEEDDEAANNGAEKRARRRPKSIAITPWILTNGLPTPTATISQPHTPVVGGRKRSISLPMPAMSPLFNSKQPQTVPQSTSTQAGDDTEHVDAEQSTIMPGDKDASVQDENPEAKEAASSEKQSKAEVGKHARRPSVSAVAPAATATAGEDHSDQDSSEYEDATEIATYEKAEIMTSSRISIAGSSASSVSDHAKASSVKRSSSVRSARIIDVPGPRSPNHSRPASIDITERSRSAGAARLAKASTVEDDRNAKKVEDGTGAPGHVSRPSIDKKKLQRQTAAPISESDEDCEDVDAKAAVSLERTDSVNTSSVATGAAESANSLAIAGQPASDLGDKKPFATKRDNVPASIKITTSRNASSTPPFNGESIPEVPQRASGRAGGQSSKADDKGKATLERQRTKETDDELELPLQTNASPRHISASTSSASSGTSRLKPFRTSEDNSSRGDSVARNFEELIQSNQTITYTLTPENMRNIDSKRSINSPVVTKFSRKSEEPRGRNSPLSSPTMTSAPKSPLSHQPRSPSSPKSGQPSGSAPRALSGLASPTGRMGGTLAREARVPTDSTADFADFIKSTGPPGEKGAVPLRKVQAPTSPTKSSVSSRRVSTTSNRSRHQPRDAVIDGKSDNSDLIDFIRQGPPIASSSHRIPRHVAPFRNTMDSDQMTTAIGGKAVDASIPEIRHSQASTNLTDSMPSMHSSVNSSSALLKNKSPAAASNMFNEEGLMPKRKQRRVRDPYAIDFSDEEDEAIDVTPKPQVKKEESLAEFLRNYDPPPEPVSAPAPQLPRKKASAPSLLGRFTRGSTKETRDSTMPSSPTAGHDTLGPLDTLAGRPRMASLSSSAARVPRKKFEPREAVSSRSQTAELAAFLRDSVPPESAIGGPLIRNPDHQEETSSFSRMFSRRKKTGLV